jgi:gamma-glutamylcyclotransferase (GGCT)/AIG2-like uncharacterized protein YtfP
VFPPTVAGEWAARGTPLTEELIQRLHALIEHGAQARPTHYRNGQNVIRDSETGRRAASSAIYRQSIGGLSAMSTYLFVYGTLMSGGENNLLLARHAELIGPGRMRGRLFVVDYYPGLVDSEDPAETVAGEVWRLLEPDVLLSLDDFEGCTEAPPLFVRASRTVTLDGGSPLAAWVYVYARSTSGLQSILSGDWRTFRGELL